MKKRTGLGAALCGLYLALGAGISNAAERYVTIGTGSDSGVYYAAGTAICGQVNANKAEHKIDCHVGSSAGSILTLPPVHRGEMEFGIVQSDWQYHAYKGTGLLAKQGAFDNLRAVFSLHAEPFTVVARAGSGISKFSDLKGRRVNIGNPGSGQRATMEVLLATIGWSTADFSLAAEYKPSEQSRALCRDDFDAMVFVAGHPNASIEEAATSCDVVLVEVDAAIIEQVVDNDEIYEPMTIPGGLYRGTANDVRTFGVRATMVSSDMVPADTVHGVVKAVFEDLPAFRKQHPALADLKAGDMTRRGLTAPLHEGAKRYFKEAGLD